MKTKVTLETSSHFLKSRCAYQQECCGHQPRAAVHSSLRDLCQNLGTKLQFSMASCMVQFAIKKGKSAVSNWPQANVTGFTDEVICGFWGAL